MSGPSGSGSSTFSAAKVVIARPTLTTTMSLASVTCSPLLSTSRTPSRSRRRRRAPASRPSRARDASARPWRHSSPSAFKGFSTAWRPSPWGTRTRVRHPCDARRVVAVVEVGRLGVGRLVAAVDGALDGLALGDLALGRVVVVGSVAFLPNPRAGRRASAPPPRRSLGPLPRRRPRAPPAAATAKRRRGRR